MQIGSTGAPDFFLACAGNFCLTTEILEGLEPFFFPSCNGIFRPFAGEMLTILTQD